MARIAIIGAGLVGRAWAISFARAGWSVALWDAAPGAAETARQTIAELLPDLKAHDLLGADAPDAVLGRVAIVATLEEALAGAEYVQENTPEVLDLKRAVFARLDAIAAPDCVLASSTSAILPRNSRKDCRVAPAVSFRIR